MALESTDLIVVQKQDGAKEIRKASLTQLSDYLQTEAGVTYKGTADFTNAGEEPGTKNVGDMYINDGVGSPGTWAWSTNAEGITDVYAGDRCLWNGTQWDVMQSGAGDVGVTEVQGSLPIEIKGTPDVPVVQIKTATTTEAGAVARLATEADVTANTGTGSTSAVVTADLLKKSNEDILSATSGGLTSVQGVDPIEVETDGSNGSTINSPAVKIKDSAIGQKGAIARFDSDTDLGDPSGSADYATWVGTIDDTAALTAKGAAANFVYADFSGLSEA